MNHLLMKLRLLTLGIITTGYEPWLGPNGHHILLELSDSCDTEAP